MTRIETVIITCDLDETPGAVPVRFALDGHAYEIDLCPAGKQQMAAQLAPYLAAARRAQQPAGRERSAAGRRETAALRAWAREHAAEYGWEISRRGRLPAGVDAAYRAARPPLVERPYELEGATAFPMIPASQIAAEAAEDMRRLAGGDR